MATVFIEVSWLHFPVLLFHPASSFSFFTPCWAFPPIIVFLILTFLCLSLSLPLHFLSPFFLSLWNSWMASAAILGALFLCVLHQSAVRAPTLRLFSLHIALVCAPFHFLLLVLLLVVPLHHVSILTFNCAASFVWCASVLNSCTFFCFFHMLLIMISFYSRCSVFSLRSTSMTHCPHA